MNNLTINESGVRINDFKIEDCTSVTVKNISVFGPMQIELTFNVDKVDIKHTIGWTETKKRDRG